MRPPAPKKGLGQHFLSDPSLLRRIVTGAGVERGERVLEIGPGPGGLTAALVEAGAEVWALELDPRMLAHLEGLRLDGVHLLQGDALAADYLALARGAGGSFRLVANLPYQISGPLLARLLKQRTAFVSMTVMLQREVAERIAAAPGGRARGILSVLAQAFCRVSPVLRLPPGAFRPPPKVDSMALRLDVLPQPVSPLDDEALLWEAVRAGFGQRRKMLRNALKAVVPDPSSAIREASLTGTMRSEELSSEAWIRLANCLGRRRRETEA